jgi:hypothetical protein
VATVDRALAAAPVWGDRQVKAEWSALAVPVVQPELRAWVAAAADCRTVRFVANRQVARCAPRGLLVAIRVEFRIAIINARRHVIRIRRDA